MNPQTIPGWFTEEQGAVLASLAKGLVCVEIGSNEGRSSTYIAQVAKRLTCVDVFASKNIRENFIRNMAEFTNVFVCVGNSSVAAGIIDDRSVDLLLVDGSHVYEDVRDDIHFMLPKMKIDGVIVFHDLDHPDYPGVRKAVEEMGKDFEIINSMAVMRLADAKGKK